MDPFFIFFCIARRMQAQRPLRVTAVWFVFLKIPARHLAATRFRKGWLLCSTAHGLKPWTWWWSDDMLLNLDQAWLDHMKGTWSGSVWLLIFVEVTSWMLMPAIRPQFSYIEDYWYILVHCIQCSICCLHEWKVQIYCFLLHSSGCLWHLVGATCVFLNHSVLEITHCHPNSWLIHGMEYSFGVIAINFHQLSGCIRLFYLGNLLFPLTNTPTSD